MADGLAVGPAPREPSCLKAIRDRRRLGPAVPPAWSSR